jgi:hypothetical protein
MWRRKTPHMAAQTRQAPFSKISVIRGRLFLRKPRPTRTEEMAAAMSRDYVIKLFQQGKLTLMQSAELCKK